MALSENARKALETAMPQSRHGEKDGTEVADMIDAAAARSAEAEALSAIGTTSDLTAVPGSFADEAAVQTYLVTLRSEVEARLDAIEAKVDAIIGALKA